MSDDNKRPYAEVLAEYRVNVPIFGTYKAIVEERNSHDGPITEPPASMGVDCLTAAEMALARLGLPTDPPFAQMTLAYVRHLESEIAALAADEAQTVESAVMGCFYPYSGHIPSLKAWEVMSTDEQLLMIDDEWIDGLDGDVLREILRMAMPMLLLHTIEWDQRRRNRLTVVPPLEAP